MKKEVQKIIMTCKSFSFEKKYEYIIYIIKLFIHLYVIAMAMAKQLNFIEETHGYPWGRQNLNKL